MLVLACVCVSMFCVFIQEYECLVVLVHVLLCMLVCVAAYMLVNMLPCMLVCVGKCALCVS